MASKSCSTIVQTNLSIQLGGHHAGTSLVNKLMYRPSLQDKSKINCQYSTAAGMAAASEEIPLLLQDPTYHTPEVRVQRVEFDCSQ